MPIFTIATGILRETKTSTGVKIWEPIYSGKIRICELTRNEEAAADMKPDTE